MVSIDDFLKLILVLSVAFAIVGISFELMRLISKLTQVIDDLRHPINNASELTDYVLEDYVDARSLIRGGIGGLANIKKYLDNPVSIASDILKNLPKIKRLLGREEE